MEKGCTKCKDIKPLDQFDKDKNRSDGLYPSCKACRKSIASSYYTDNKDKVKCSHRNWYSKSYIKKSRPRQTKAEKAQKKREYYLRWYAHNSGRSNARYRSDLSYRLRAALRARLVIAIKNNQKSGSAIRDLGCTIEELKLYLESKFQPGMGWENWGRYGWHIDHVIPLSAFDLTDPVQLRLACHYTNLQPLWAADNLLKSNKVL